MNPDDSCLAQNTGRRRLFWTTRPEACGRAVVCGVECVLPGLEYEDKEEGRTIVTSDWLRSLILNILNTKARNDLRCSTPAAVAGHWSESYRGDALWIGSKLWNAAAKPYIRVSDAVRAINAAITADMNKLTALGLATKVAVDTVYRGGNRVDVTIVVNEYSPINLSGTLASNVWVWL